MSQTRCAGCGLIPSGAHDLDRDLWYCLDCAQTRPATYAHPPAVGESPRALAGVLGGVRAITGKAPDGERIPKGALPWHWCYGNQPVHCEGAVYADSDEGRHLVHGISDREAQRETALRALADVAGDPERVPVHVRNIVAALNPAQLRRRGMRRRV